MASPGLDTERQVIFLAEDDLELAALIKDFLEGEGYCVLLEADGRVARDRILETSPDLVILDVMLPGMNGYSICQEIRQTYRGPVLFLTARDEELDEILGLEMGGDDYLTKPVKPQVLLARLRALLRRVSGRRGAADARCIPVGSLTVDASRREVRVGQRQIDVTTLEFDLLWFLAERAGEVVSRQAIYQALFHYDYDGMDRSVDVYVSRLRQKLGLPVDAFSIKTVRGVGYLMAEGGGNHVADADESLPERGEIAAHPKKRGAR